MLAAHGIGHRSSAHNRATCSPSSAKAARITGPTASSGAAARTVGSALTQVLLDALDLGGQLAVVPGADVGLEHQADAWVAGRSTSTACLTTAITSSHSPSMLVNIALVSQGSPESRITPHGLGDGAG